MATEKAKDDARSTLQLARNKYLVRDRFQMWIATRVKVKGEDVYRRNSGYYSTYESLFDGYVREQGKLLQGEEIETQLAEFAKIEKQLRQFARKIGKELDEREEP